MPAGFASFSFSTDEATAAVADAIASYSALICAAVIVPFEKRTSSIQPHHAASPTLPSATLQVLPNVSAPLLSLQATMVAVLTKAPFA